MLELRSLAVFDTAGLGEQNSRPILVSVFTSAPAKLRRVILDTEQSPPTPETPASLFCSPLDLKTEQLVFYIGLPLLDSGDHWKSSLDVPGGVVP